MAPFLFKNRKTADRHCFHPANHAGSLFLSRNVILLGDPFHLPTFSGSKSSGLLTHTLGVRTPWNGTPGKVGGIPNSSPKFAALNPTCFDQRAPSNTASRRQFVLWNRRNEFCVLCACICLGLITLERKAWQANVESPYFDIHLLCFCLNICCRHRFCVGLGLALQGFRRPTQTFLSMTATQKEYRDDSHDSEDSKVKRHETRANP